MLEFFKKFHYQILITTIYTVLAALIYGVWSFSAWQLWYVTLIIVIIILTVGTVLGYMWVKHEMTKDVNVDAK